VCDNAVRLVLCDLSLFLRCLALDDGDGDGEHEGRCHGGKEQVLAADAPETA
jgi:hypothetical protein